jgi:pimeloyl-ACP methyl ester carboxylesterase
VIAEGVAEKTVELSHGKVRYFEAGTGTPAIFLHGVGFTSGGDAWEFMLPELGKHMRAIAPDFLGWGPGDRIELEYSFPELADFVREFQDALGIEKSHIIGHSMGGWVASVFAYESPDRVDKLVLVAAGGAATRTLPSMTGFKPPAREDILNRLKQQVKVPGADLERMADEGVKHAERPGVVDAYQRIMNRMNNPVVRKQYNTLRRLPHIKVPTLVAWGRDDQTNSIELGEQIHSLLPNSKLVVFDNTAHFIPSENPAELTKAIVDFFGEK